MPFYEYNQNNSGGTWDVTDTVCHRLFIEADSKESANCKAEELGVYFDGCAEGKDCDCCGDRWTTPWEEVKFPMPYGGMTKANAEAVAEKYKVVARPLTKGKGYSNYTHEVVFETVDQYARYLADEYGWTEPDVRIYYANGAVLTISSEKATR